MTTVESKTCPGCGVTKPLTEYGTQKGNGRPRSACRSCERDRANAYLARRRAELGDEAFKAERRDKTRRLRANPDRDYDTRQRRAYTAALVRLRDAHRGQFDVFYAAERKARGL